MYGNYEIEKLLNEYNSRIKERANANIKIWLYIALAFFIGFIAILFLADWFTTEAGIVLGIVFGIIIFGSLGLGVGLSKYFARNKVVFEYLFKEIYQQINQDNDWEIEYRSNPKVKNDFVSEGGLFSKYARGYVARSVKGVTDNKNPFVIFDVKLITGGGQYQQVHLDGLYFMTKVSCDNVFQIRTNGKPNTKQYAFDKQEIDDLLKVYTKSGTELGLIERAFLSKIKELKIRLNAKHIYLSVIDNNLHLAYMSKSIPRGKNISSSQINYLEQVFIDEIKLIDELVALTDY